MKLTVLETKLSYKTVLKIILNQFIQNTEVISPIEKISFLQNKQKKIASTLESALKFLSINLF